MKEEAKKDKAKETGRVKTFLLEIPEEIWNKWKDGVPRSISLNKALIELLDREGKNNDKK